ncbi:MAG: glycoside hydrolase family 88 protein, partial [Clostridia bacterium]
GYTVDASAPSPKALLAADVYAELYMEIGEEKLLEAAKNAADSVTAESCESIEAVYMTLPLLGKMYTITEDERYILEIEKFYSHLRETLYDESTHLFFENAQAATDKIYWSRGNGFALSGLADIIEILPDGELKNGLTMDYKDLAEVVFSCRTDEGYYTRRLTDHEYYPGFETGGTAYIIYGLAKGVNMGLLDKEAYSDSINRGFKFIAGAVKDSGQVGFVQQRDSSGGEQGVALDGSATGGYAAGAVMLAGIETEKMNSGLTSDMEMLRPYGEKRGYVFSYDINSGTVTAEKDGNVVELTIGELKADVNKEEITLTKGAVIFNGRTYIAAEDLGKILGNK